MLPNIPILAAVPAKGTFLGLVTINRDLIFQIINTIILFFALRHFLFKPVKNIMDERQNLIVSEIDEAKNKNETADKLIKEYQEKLENLEDEGRAIIKEASIKANNRADEIIEEANKEAESIVLRAQKEIERQKVKAVNELKEDIVNLTILAASKVLDENMNDDKNKVLVNQFLDDLGDSTWQN